MKVKSAARKKKRAVPPSAQFAGADGRSDLLIAAIGASAGGIEAFTELLQNLPADTGMAFVLIQHLDPKHHSMLTEVASKHTSMQVNEVTDGMKVRANRVYIIPPNAIMSISDHTLQLSPRPETGSVQMTIDRFMRSLAEAQGNRAIGVILSGYGTDGTLGMCEIQAQGGVTFAQDDAKFDSMPKSAAEAGYADYVLPPKGIARELARIARHPYVAKAPLGGVDLISGADSGLSAILQSLRKFTGVDFTQYREGTVLRRIHRRMVVHKIDKIGEYARFVQANPAETKALYQDMLINVTSFFRNPQLFDALKTKIFPRLLKNRISDQIIRVWTPACSSGEETYSLAIALLEFLGGRAPHVSIQLFGTDISEAAIAKARGGTYPENIQGDVSAERLRRFFTKAEHTYRISKTVRDMCIFAQHNVLDDPPFSQMDIVSCRNVLIYLEPAAQSRVVSLFHYALCLGGFLVLGSSEGVGVVSNLFEAEDRAHKIFSKKGLPARQIVTFSLKRRFERGEEPEHAKSAMPVENFNYLDAQKEFDSRLLTHYAPAGAFVNEDMEIIHTRGNISRYFELAAGRASLNLLKMAREGLLMDLRNAISRAKKADVPVRKENVSIKAGNGNGESKSHPVRSVNFEVTPVRIGKMKGRYFMLVFEDSPAKPAARKGVSRRARAAESRVRQVVKLDRELAATKEYLQSVVESQEAMNEQLQAANEEIMSSNEELQSTNEELETAKEELQSANEELTTVNDELRSRNTEISQANNDLTNLLVNAELASVVVGSDLTIRRFTPPAEKIFGLIPGDVGRPIAHINPPIDIPNLQETLVRALSGAQITEAQIADKSGNWYLVRISPYRVPGDKIVGALVTAVPSKTAGS